jgi:Tfp pilus assembly protein PilN
MAFINLLPSDLKADIRAARTNVILFRYMSILFVALIFILGVLYVYYAILQSTMASSQAQIQTNDIEADIYSETRQQVSELSSKLAEAKTTLDQETRYSLFLTTLGQTMPPGTILDSLTLDDTHFNGTPFELKAYAKTNDEAVALGNQFKAASQLFTQVDIQSTSDQGGIDGYPFTVTMSVSLAKPGAL